MNSGSHLDIGDYASIGLNVPTLLAIFADVLYNTGNGISALETYTEWYTKGVGAIVVTINAIILYRKIRRKR